MKTITLLAVRFISYIALDISLCWLIIQSVLYFIKDIKFNWWCVHASIISLIIFLTSNILLEIMKKKLKKEMGSKTNQLKILTHLKKEL